MQMIKTVIFDIGNVMVDFCFDQFIARYGYCEHILERIRNATLGSGFWKELDRGLLSYEEVLGKFIEKDPEMEPQIRQVLSDTKGIVLKREHAVSWVRNLKAAGYQVLALSNYPEKVYLDNPEPLAFLDDMDGYILSYRDHVIKPEEAIYRLLMQRYGFCPEECVFIDDLQENLDAAAGLGWHTIRYQSYEQAKSELAKMGVV